MATPPKQQPTHPRVAKLSTGSFEHYDSDGEVFCCRDSRTNSVGSTDSNPPMFYMSGDEIFDEKGTRRKDKKRHKSEEQSGTKKMGKPSIDESSEGEEETDGIKGAFRRLSFSSSSKSKRKDRRMSNIESSEDFSSSLPNSKSDVPLLERFTNPFRSFRGRLKSSKTTPDLKQIGIPFTSKVLKYSKQGRGYFLLFVNFSNELEGYRHDRKCLLEFYIAIGYTCKEFSNCSHDEMFRIIEEAKEEIRNMRQTPDCLVVAVLTHGDVDGIHTCANSDGILREQEPTGGTRTVKKKDGTTEEIPETRDRVTSVEKIIAKFKHDKDNLPELKDKPKFFIIQACQGQEIARAAGGKPSMFMQEQADGPADRDLEEEMYTPKHLPIDADILLLQAATKYNKAFVSDGSGSWLIQSLLEVFKNLYKTEEVEQMLKCVTQSVSCKQKGIKFRDENGIMQQAVAVQVPCRQSTLRKKFYL